MKTYGCLILAIVLLASAGAWAADLTPVVFAHSGQKATMRVGSDAKQASSLVLTAYGKRWGEPATVNSGAVEFVAPEVRAPIVFRPATVADGKIVSGELVVYPDHWIPWDKDPELRKLKDTQFVAVGVPDWLDSWLAAVEFTVEKFSGPEMLGARHWRMLEKPGLLLVGRKAAGGSPDDSARLAADFTTNVLVLDAEWFGDWEPAGNGFAVQPKRGKGATPGAEGRDRWTPSVFQGALADLEAQDWPLPPVFRDYSVPWPEIANRLTWLAGPQFPLVEEIRRPQKGAESLRTVASYLPWQGQLGRCGVADELFLRLLTETAKGGENQRPTEGRWSLLYPAAKAIKFRQRPVLASARKAVESKYGEVAAAAAESQRGNVRGYVIDLRGAAPPDNLWYRLDAERAIEPRIDQRTPLLILGDSPVLDSWRWLQLDRQHQKSPRPGVVWLPDGSLPPSLATQLHVMEFFTKLNIFLEKPKETDHEERESEP